ncbi:hypothetical protein BMJ22_24775 [Sinorhizobium medicae]|uniref:Uncharacterized protein n=4 Tax=Sinorhizobium TaxID=28105 RepID=A0A508X5S6_9HYPH|nr:hypothetical protein BMJ22_24775 [Sinorhizobium medicae]VTZ64997.1 conserved hypothetical protein [Sinorhizobium medicae]
MPHLRIGCRSGIGERRGRLFALDQRPVQPTRYAPTKTEITMSDAQIGLSVATPIIIIFALVLYRMGVLQRTGTAAAVLASLACAAVLFIER